MKFDIVGHNKSVRILSTFGHRNKLQVWSHNQKYCLASDTVNTVKVTLFSFHKQQALKHAAEATEVHTCQRTL